MKKKTLLSLLLVGVMAMSLLVGCGDSASEAGSADAASATEAAPEAEALTPEEAYKQYMIDFINQIAVEGNTGEQSIDEIIQMIQDGDDFTAHPYSMLIELFGAMTFEDFQATL